MFKGVTILFLPALLALLYSYGALHISTHHKGVEGIRTGTLRVVKGAGKGLKGVN